MKTEKKIQNARQGLLLLLMLAFTLVILVGNILPQLPSSSALRDSFWANKIDNDNLYDIVIVGDSRIYRGINPSVIQQKIPASVFNFGFSSAGLDSMLLSNAAALLKTNGRKILLIGVTPASFTGESLNNGHFKTLKSIPNKDFWIQKHFYPHLTFFDNYSFSDLKKISHHENYYQTFYANGFVYSNKTPVDTFEAFKPYIDYLNQNKIDKIALSDFLSMIRRFQSNGITCYAFRVPLSMPIKELENSAFDFKAFVKAFNQANGHWIELSGQGLSSYDGSHLDGKSANKLSGVLADTLNRYH